MNRYLVRANDYTMPRAGLRRSRTRFVVLAALIVSIGVSSTANSSPPAVSVIEAPLIDPDTANNYFETAPVSATSLRSTVNIPGVMSGAQYRARFRELARSLGAGRLSANDFAARVYEYIHNNIETEFRYGLGKGGFGTILDQSGTPFDQAELMVQLMSTAGFSASYEAGTITLTGAQFGEWTGLTTAAATCRYLADGGIPARINGTALADCNYGAGASLNSVVMSHVWVVANGMRYDPSYKRYQAIDGMPNLRDALQCGASGCGAGARSALLTGATVNTGSGAPAPYVQNLNTAQLSAQLKGYATNLRSHLIQNGLTTSSLEEVVGGRALIPPTGLMPSVFFPHSTFAVQRIWSSDIPGQYRTQLRLEFDNFDLWLFADELYGFGVRVESVLGYGLSNSTPFNRTMQLKMGNVELGQSVRANGFPNNDIATFTVDHPYSAPARTGAPVGSFGDETITKNLMITQECRGQNASIIPNCYQHGSFTVISYIGQIGRGNNVQNGNASPGSVGTWLAQSTRAGGLIDSINATLSQRHHSVGAFSSAVYGELLDAQSTLSVTSPTMNSADRSATIRSFAAVDNALEGGSIEQERDTWGILNSVGAFTMANSKGYRFYDVQAQNLEATLAATVQYTADDYNFIRTYFQVGGAEYRAVIPSSGQLGTWSFTGGSGNSSVTYIIAPLAFYTPDDSQIAYVTTAGNKGAGGPGDPTNEAQKSVQQAHQAELLRNQYSVDLASGTLKFQPAADILSGSGKFPYSLPFQRTYSSKRESDIDGSYLTPSGTDILASTVGGTHNYHIGARFFSDAFIGMGSLRAMDAVSTISALVALRDLSNDGTDFQSRVGSVFVADWLSDQYLSNGVNVRNGPTMLTFVRRPDGGFDPPAHTSGNLTQTGSKVPVMLGTVIGYEYDNVRLSLTYSDGSVMSLSPGHGQLFAHPSGPIVGGVTINWFKPDTWVFPDGVSVAFGYETYTNTVSDPIFNIPLFWRSVLRTVSNSLGRQLRFEYRLDTLTTFDVTGRYFRVIDENNRTFAIDNFQLEWTGLETPPAPIQTTMYQGDMTWPDGQVGRFRFGRMYETAEPFWRDAPITIYAPGDLQNPALTIEFDALDRVSRIRDKSNQATDFYPARVSDERFSRGESVNAEGGLTSKYFDRSGRVVQSIDALNRAASRSYYGNGLLRLSTAPEGNSTEYTYDVRGNVVKETHRPKPGSAAPTLMKRIGYNEGESVFTCSNIKTCNQPAWTEDARGNRTTYAYYANGQLESVMGPAVTNGVAGTSYAHFGYTPYTGIGSLGGSISLLSSITQRVDNSRNRVSTFTYNPSNKLVLDTATLDPSGFNLQTRFTFDAVGNVRTIDGPRPGTGDLSTYWFDNMRRLTRADAPLNQRTRYTYYADGALRTSSSSLVPTPTDANPANPFAVFGTDLVASQWSTVEQAYFPTGDLQWVKDPEGNTTSYVYDPVGRTTIVTDPDGRRVATVYNLAGETVCSFKAWDSTTPPSTADCNSWNPASYTSATSPLRYAAYTYTDNGKQLTVKDANNNETRYQYDGLDRLAYAFFPDPDSGALCGDAPAGGSPACGGRATYEQYGYDDNGNRISLRTRKGETITTTYDAMNRVWTKQAQGQAQVTYGYNLSAEPTSLSDGAHSIGYDYDSAGRKSYETNDGRQVSYLYDEAGNRTRTTWPEGYYIRYQYDVLNRMEYVWDHNNTELAHYEYDALSRRNFLTYGNNANNKIAYTYEADSNLRTLQHIMNLGVNFTYDHNHSGQITGIDATDGFYLTHPRTTSTTGYMVNKLNQYVGVGPQTGTDANGNPIVASAPSSKKWVTIPIDDLSIVIPVKGKIGSTPEVNQPDPGGDSMVHDLNGNLVRWSSTKGRALYTYDSENRLRTTAFDGSTVAGISYEYDPLGRRISKTVNGTMTRYLLDGDEEVAEYDASWNLLRRYITGPAIDDRIAMQSGGAYSYYRTNHQGSVIALTDSGGTAGDRYAYDEYGNLTAGSTSGQPFRYTGRRFDEETGLYYYRARYYSPTLGRFLQTDPIGYEDDFNLYAYVGNDPINANDPLGTKTEEISDCSSFQESPVRGACESNVDYDSEERSKLQQARQPLQNAIKDVNEGAEVAEDVVVVGYESWVGGKVIGKAVHFIVGMRYVRFTRGNFRSNLVKLTGKDPKDAQAHHVFSQAEHLQKLFASKGIDIHDPKYGAWWDKAEHAAKSYEYNKKWEVFLDTNPTKKEILNYARILAGKYGYDLNF